MTSIAAVFAPLRWSELVKLALGSISGARPRVRLV